MKAHLLTTVLIIGFVGLGLKPTSTMAQTIIYVKADGTGDGTSWANAYNMDDALDIANTVSAFASDIQIWVMKGTYTPSKMLTIPTSVKMYGSFAGTEGALEDRDIAANPTILDGQKKFGSVVRLEPFSVLDGFTVQNGSAQANPLQNGGGVYACDSTVIANCIITQNSANAYGGGVYAKDALKIVNSKVEGNTALLGGQNIYGCCITIEGGGCFSPYICSRLPVLQETRATIDKTPFRTLTVRMVGTGPFTYQWYSNTSNSTVSGTIVPVSTDSAYTPPHTAIGQLYYFVVVKNACGVDTSNVSGLHAVAPLVTNYDYTGGVQSVVLPPGQYIVECWGAQGGSQRSNSTSGNQAAITGTGSKGGYAKGTLDLTATTSFYIYVGQLGGTGGTRGSGYSDGGVAGWNGGGTGGSDADNDVGGGGGGATDIRIVSGAWNNVASLRSRIMVAGGGGGSHPSGVGGGVNGGTNNSLGQSTQTTGNAFGIGQAGGSQNVTGWVGNGGGGGGWYGGRTDGNRGSGHSAIGGNGGSGFISGHAGCNAVNASGTHLGNPNSYTGLVFTKTSLTAGNASMPNPRGTGNITGNSGHGFARITRTR